MTGTEFWTEVPNWASQLDAKMRKYLLASVCLQWRFRRLPPPAGISVDLKLRAVAGHLRQVCSDGHSGAESASASALIGSQ